MIDYRGLGEKSSANCGRVDFWGGGAKCSFLLGVGRGIVSGLDVAGVKLVGGGWCYG